MIDDDPFGAVGDYVGSFLVKSAVELSPGYDTNPGRLAVPQGSPFSVVAPEFLAVSDWERHARGRRPARLLHRLRQQFDAERQRHAAVGAARCRPPVFIGHIDGRLDVSPTRG